MSEKWTDEQLCAIDGRGGSLLVSAAAGSGKTAVLVERVIRRLTDTQNPCPADKMLIVTFTRAAASQMRERIAAALSEQIKQNPGNTALLRQQINLRSAKICTTDSFCSDLVRENFHLTEIGADFSILDESDADALHLQAITETVEEMYAEGDKGFIELANLLSAGKSDDSLIDALLKIFKYIQSFPDPEERLDELCSGYRSFTSVADSFWGKTVFAYADDLLSYCSRVIENATEVAKEDAVVEKAYLPALTEEAQIYAQLSALAKSRKWNELMKAVGDYSQPRLGSARNCDVAISSAVKVRRGVCKDLIGALSKNLCCSEEECAEDIKKLAPCAEMLAECVKRFSKKLTELKYAQNSLEFNDIEHIALNMLIRKTDSGEIIKTELAEEISEGFAEIIVDEFQDTNKLQDMLFSALSRNRQNLFTVGDVKQSIYRFRQAMPEIFLEQRDSLPLYKREIDAYPAKVFLGKNFRSRKGITDAVNYLFSTAMSVKTGELKYDDNEALVCGADYSEHSEPDFELHLLENPSSSIMTECEAEAKYVAELVENLLNSGMTVGSGEKLRPVSRGDICIILRARKAGDDDAFDVFSAALAERGISACAESNAKLTDTAEINMFVSLLRVIDNPVQDVPLAAVMLSPLFGFTPDEMAKMRIADRNSSLYRCVSVYAESGDEKSAAFLEKLKALRRLSVSLSAAELVRRLTEETRICAVASSMSQGEQRVANLRLLQECANKFDSAGGCGLSAFLRYFDRIESIKSESKASVNTDAVNIMTVHKSKGLEFPICILARTSKQFNRFDERSNIIVSSEAGIGLAVREKRLNRPALTLPLTACAIAVRRLSSSEEMRVLYVAMTRAKEKFIAVATYKDVSKKLEKLGIAASFSGRELPEFPVSQAPDAAEWIVSSFMKHPDCVALRNSGGYFPSNAISKTESRVVCKIDESWHTSAAQEQSEETPEADENEISRFTALIESRLAYSYPYAKLTVAVSKKEASGFSDAETQREFFASALPSFMGSGGFSAAQKGTAMHKFLQLCDFTSDLAPIEQLSHFTADGSFTEEQAKAMDIAALNSFFDSELFARMRRSEEIIREKQFAMLVPAKEIYPQLADSSYDEEIVVKGMVDCLFIENGEAVIVDYKTDRNVTEEELRERHSPQLKIYARAVEACTDYKVKETLLYSFSLKKSIKIL